VNAGVDILSAYIPSRRSQTDAHRLVPPPAVNPPPPLPAAALRPPVAKSSSQLLVRRPSINITVIPMAKHGKMIRPHTLVGGVVLCAVA
jgi:hypothetical protein